jgi:hypothetical protein
MFRKTVIGMLGLCLMMALGTSVDAFTLCPVSGGIGGSILWIPCGAYTNTIICPMSARGAGNICDTGGTLACTAEQVNTWVVACKNPSHKNTPPGIQTFSFEGELGASVSAEGACDQNGNIRELDAYTDKDSPDFEALLWEATQAGACKGWDTKNNSYWEAVDIAPCAMVLHDIAKDGDGNILDEKWFSCSLGTLEECGSLGWDKVRQAFDMRQYDCKQCCDESCQTFCQ